jgi:hypothetical protein
MRKEEKKIDQNEKKKDRTRKDRKIRNTNRPY